MYKNCPICSKKSIYKIIGNQVTKYSCETCNKFITTEDAEKSLSLMNTEDKKNLSEKSININAEQILFIRLEKRGFQTEVKEMRPFIPIECEIIADTFS